MILMGVIILVMGFFYGLLFSFGFENFIMYFILGMIFWVFLLVIINELCGIFNEFVLIIK